MAYNYASVTKTAEWWECKRDEEIMVQKLALGRGLVSYYIQILEMQSDQHSIREMFQFPHSQHQRPPNKKKIKSNRTKFPKPQQSKPQKQSFWKVVRVAKNVSLFIQTLKRRVGQNRSFDSHNLKAGELAYLQNDSQTQTKRALFAHDNKLVLATEVVYVAILLLYFWQCTYEMVLGDITDYQTINALALAFYFLHIVLQQVTELKNQKSELITDMNLIREVYRREKLIRDVISVTSLVLQITPFDTHDNGSTIYIVIRVISLLAYFELSQTCEKIEHVVTISLLGETVVSLLKLLFKLFVFIHGISIFLIWLASIESSYGNQTTWLSNPNLSYSSNLDKYVLAWYWGCTILSSVGFGDITPSNNLERFLVSLLEVTSCIFFGYFVNAVGEMIKVRSEYSEKYLKQVRSLNRFLSLLSITNDLKHKLRKHYFNKNLVQSMCEPRQEKQVLNTITPNLKKSLLQQINLKILKKCTQLEKFSCETINRIAQSLKRAILAPEYLLYSRNSNDRKIWLIQDGVVEEFTDNFKDATLRKVLAVYDSKQPLVGWINFVTPHPYKTLAKSKNFTVTHELDEQQFMRCLSQSKKDFNKFNELKQRLIEKRKMFHSKCISCGRFTHNVIECPRIHIAKKQAYRVIKLKMQLEAYIEGQSPKVERNSFRNNWKRIFGSGELQTKANLLANNNTSIDMGPFGGFLDKLSLRKSVFGFDRRKPSFLQFNEKENQKKESHKSMEMEDRSGVSDEIIEQEMNIEFERVFFNKDNDDYFPLSDVEKVLSDYQNKSNAKKNTERVAKK